MHRILAGLLILAPMTAYAGAHRFGAELASTPADGRLISGSLSWTCAGPRCAATGDMSDSPARLCARLVKDAGRIQQFTVDGAPLDETAMRRCNARARDTQSLARN